MPEAAAGLHDRGDLEGLPLADQVRQRAGVTTRISSAATRPPPFFLSSVCATTPLSDSESIVRICSCRSAGNWSMMPVDGGGSGVGVQRAEDQVAGLGGLDGDRDRLQVAHLAHQDDVRVLAQRRAQGAPKPLVCAPTSRWLMRHCLSWWTNSIGSSMVMMWSSRCSLMWSIIAASVVDLPLPVGPGDHDEPLVHLAEVEDRPGGAPAARRSGSWSGSGGTRRRRRRGPGRRCSACARGPASS